MPTVAPRRRKLYAEEESLTSKAAAAAAENGCKISSASKECMVPEAAGELALPLVGGCGRAYDFPLSRAEKVGRLLSLFQEEVDNGLAEERAFREEMHCNIKQLKAEFRSIRRKVAAAATAAAETQISPQRSLSRSGSPPKTPPTPPPQPRQPRQSAPPAPLSLGRRRSSVVVVPLFPKGFDPSADQCDFGATSTSEACGMAAAAAADPSSLATQPGPPAPRSRRRSSVIVSETGVRLNQSTEQLRPRRRSSMEASRLLLTQTPPRTFLEATPEEDEFLVTQVDEYPYRGSIVAIQWGGKDAVDWLRLLPVGEGDEENIPQQNHGATLRERLNHPGEYIKAIYGRAEIDDGRFADWVTVETTRRKLQIGEQNIYSPTFSFVAAEGHELVAAEIGPSGRIQGAKQQQLLMS